MSGNTGIAWTDATWNPVVGCTKVSAGCKNCYAETMARRLRAMGVKQYLDVVDDKGHWTGKVNLVEEALELPLKWKKPRMVFVNSMSDLFHGSVPFEFISKVFAIMEKCPQHTFQILTKRPEIANAYIKHFDCALPENVWIGVSIESQDHTQRFNDLLEGPYIPLPMVSFISFEPLLGPIDINGVHYMGSLCQWVIIGCESGPVRRPCELHWVRDLVTQCRDRHIRVFVKQLSIDGKVSHDMSEWPEDLRIREYPNGWNGGVK